MITLKRLLLTLTVLFCGFMTVAFVPNKALAADRVVCTGESLKSGACKATAGEDITIDLSDLRLAPGMYAIMYRDKSQSDYFLRCQQVGNDRRFRQERFPGSSIGIATLQLWKVNAQSILADPCGKLSSSPKLFESTRRFIQKRGSEISRSTFKIEFEPPQWTAEVDYTQSKPESVAIKIQGLPADGDFVYRLKTRAHQHQKIKSSGKGFTFSVSNTLYRPGMKLQVWRWSGNPLEPLLRDTSNDSAFLGEAVIGDSNPCAPTGNCPEKAITATSPTSAGGRLPYSDITGIIEFCDEAGSVIRTGLGCIPTDASQLVSWILRFSLGIGGGLALLLMSFAGIEIMTSQGDPEKLNEGKERFTSAIIGLAFVVMSVFLLRVIGVDILGTPTV